MISADDGQLKLELFGLILTNLERLGSSPVLSASLGTIPETWNVPSSVSAVYLAANLDS